jgi:hypothetical protein
MITVNKANPTPGEITSSLTGSTGDGAGLHFNGAGNISFTPVDLGSKFSHEFVIKADEDLTTGSSSYIIDYEGGSGRFVIGAEPTQASGNLAIYDDAGWKSFGVNPLTDLKVHHIVVTVDGTAAVLYDNGNQVGTATINANHGIDNATAAAIGSNFFTATSNNFEGTIYRARVYNHTLSADDVRTAYERADVDFADQYGSQTELVTNGTFATDSNWTKGTGWSIGSGVASSDGTQTGNSEIYQSVSFAAGKRYRLSYEVAAFTSGQVRFLLGSGGTGGTWRSATGTYVEEFVADSASTSNLHIQANSTFVGSVDNVSFKAIGCVSDYDLAFASPTQSLTVQDRSGAADGTCSASGVTQVQPVVQLNSTSARIGTSAATPADGSIVASGQIKTLGGALATPSFAFEEEAGLGISRPTGNTLNFVTSSTERMRIGEQGHVLVGTTALDANVGAKKIQLEGSASTSVGPEMLLHNPAQGGGAASLLTFGGKASGTEGYTAAIKATNTGTLTIGTAHASGGFSEPAADLTISSTGDVTVNESVAIGTTPTSGISLNVRENSTTTAADIRNANASGFGLYVAGGSSSSEYAFRAANKDNNALFTVRGDGVAEVSGGIITSEKGVLSGSVTVADDAVTTITPQRKGGFINILADTTAGDGGFPVKSDSAQIWFDCGSSLNIEKLDIGTVIGSQVETSTSNLTGTTGTDGRVTVSVQSDVIQIENRQNATRIFNYTIIC